MLRTGKSYACEACGFDVVEGLFYDWWVVPFPFAADCVQGVTQVPA